MMSRSNLSYRQTLYTSRPDVFFYVETYEQTTSVCLTKKIIVRFLVCIKVEVLGLFVLLSLAIETCGIEETFLTTT